jgi:hypothetical protein
MEKYSKWRDLGTGIQPFLHPKPPRRNPQYFLIIIKSALFPIKILLTVALLSILFLLDLLSIVLFHKVLIYYFRLITGFIIIRTVLFINGFYYIKTHTKNNKSLRNSNIYICNYTGYIDLLYHRAILNPQFLLAKDQKVKPISLWNLIFSSDDFTGYLPLDDYIVKNKGILMILFEGCSSNGKSILKSQLESSRLPDMNVRATKYEFNNFCPCFTVGSLVGHYCSLAFELKHKMIVYSFKNASNINKRVDCIIADLIELKVVELGLNDKIEFTEYFNKKKK